MEKQLSTFTDLELATLVDQFYQQLIQAQSNLMAVNGERQRRVSSCAKSESVSE